MPVDDLTDLVRRLDRQDRARQLTAKYAYSIDDRDWAGLANVFAEDAVLNTSVGVVHGRVAITDWYQQYMESTMPGWLGRHFIVNHRFQESADPDELGMHCYFFYTFRGSSESIVGWGRYEFAVSFAGPEAKVGTMTITVDSQSDVRQGWEL